MNPAHLCPHKTMADRHRLSTPLPWNIQPAIFPIPRTRTRCQQRLLRYPISRSTIPHSRATTSTTVKMWANMTLIKGTRYIQERRLGVKIPTSNMIRVTIRKSSINNTPIPHIIIMPLTMRRLPAMKCLCKLNTRSTVNPPLKVCLSHAGISSGLTFFEGYLDLGGQMFDEHPDCFNGHDVTHYQ